MGSRNDRSPGDTAHLITGGTDRRGYRGLSRLWRKAGRPESRRGRPGGISRRAAIIAGAAAVSVATDYPDWAPHVAQAQQIAATGVPLLTAASVVYNAAGVNIAGNSAYAPGPQVVSQIGYEFWIQASTGAAATVPFLQVKLTWDDTVSGRTVATDTFTVPAASSAGGFVVAGRGPSKASQVVLTVLNLDPAIAASVNLVMLQNSRVYPKDDWRWLMGAAAPATVPGFTLPSLPADESVLGIVSNITIPAGANSSIYLCGMHNGLVAIGLNVSAGTLSALDLQLAAAPNTVYGSNNPLSSGPPQSAAYQIAGPRAPIRVIFHNTSTAAMTLTASLIALS